MKFKVQIYTSIICLLLGCSLMIPTNVSAVTLLPVTGLNQKLPAPTSLTASSKYVPATSTTTAKKGIELRWTNPQFSSFNTVYEIYRSTSSTGPFSKIKTVSFSTSSFLDTTINVNVTYYYKIRANLSYTQYSDFTAVANAKYISVSGIVTNNSKFTSIVDKVNPKIGVTLSPSNATNRSLKFTSSNSSICAVSSSGVLTGKISGTALITITSVESPAIKTTVTCTSIKYLRPAAGGITEYFGYRTHPVTGEPDNHKGIDISKNNGLRIIATRDGIVKTARTAISDGAGRIIIIDHGDGTESRYYHLDQLYVTVGQKVTAGQQIAKMGTTGVSTGIHLHFEIRINGIAVNPLNYVNMNSTFVCTSGCR